jgi:CheY-like chemotaxis protein
MPTPIVVLVVEGEPELRDMLIEALGWEGFEVVAARDEAEATKVLRDRAIDLLVSDPPSFEDVQRAMDVLAALEREFPDLPVIAVAEEVPEPVGVLPSLDHGRSEAHAEKAVPSLGSYRRLPRSRRGHDRSTWAGGRGRGLIRLQK